MNIKSSTYLFQNTADFPLRVSIQEKQDPTKLHSHECVELVCVYDGRECTSRKPVGLRCGREMSS